MGGLMGGIRAGFSTNSTFDFDSKLGKEIDSISPSILVNGDLQLIAKSLESKFLLNRPTLNKTEAHISEENDCKVDVRKDPNRWVSDRTKPCLVNGKRIVVSVPLEGDANLLMRKPISPNGVTGEVSVESDRIDLIYTLPHPIDKEFLDRDIRNDINAITANMGFETVRIDSFNRELLPKILQMLNARRIAIQNENISLIGLSVPLRIRKKNDPVKQTRIPNNEMLLDGKKHEMNQKPKLAVKFEEADRQVQEQLNRGNEISSRVFTSDLDINKAFDDTESWCKYTHTLLSQIFDQDNIADEFSDWLKIGYDKDLGITYSEPTLEQSIRYFRDNIDPKINRLRSIKDRLVLYKDLEPLLPSPKSQPRIEIIPGRHDYDAFISHASEDKDDIARPLFSALTAGGAKVWFDELTLEIGDSLRGKIDDGLLKSRFGIVVMSPEFFKKNWTQYELDGLVNLQNKIGQKVILPVWHNLSHDDISAISPSLASLVAGSTKVGVNVLADKLLKIILKAESA